MAAFSINFLAGDPTYVLIGDMRGMTEQDIQEFRHRMGFDRPVPVQYFDWLSKAVQGDFGTSFKFRENNWAIIAERFPATLQLACFCIIGGIDCRYATGDGRGREPRLCLGPHQYGGGVDWAVHPLLLDGS